MAFLYFHALNIHHSNDFKKARSTILYITILHIHIIYNSFTLFQLLIKVLLFKLKAQGHSDVKEITYYQFVDILSSIFIIQLSCRQ
jgi:hypothetical protein